MRAPHAMFASVIWLAAAPAAGALDRDEAMARFWDCVRANIPAWDDPLSSIEFMAGVIQERCEARIYDEAAAAGEDLDWRILLDPDGARTLSVGVTISEHRTREK